jgi:uncharacterized protein
MWLVKLLIGLALAYSVVVALIFLAQTWLIFPTSLAGQGAPALPPEAERLELETPDGERLEGTRIPASQGDGAARPALLGFGGNAWNADALALYLHHLFPDRDAIAFHYRGYSPSTGRPGAAAILDDAPLIYDFAAEELAQSGIVLVGLSIGAGPAARIAADRTPRGTILVTPFDSLKALAQYHYPWVPVGPFLRHRMPVADLLGRADGPVAVISAENDTIVPAARTLPVTEAARNLVYKVTLAGIGHNDLYDSSAFHEAIRHALRTIETR